MELCLIDIAEAAGGGPHDEYNDALGSCLCCILSSVSPESPLLIASRREANRELYSDSAGRFHPEASASSGTLSRPFHNYGDVFPFAAAYGRGGSGGDGAPPEGCPREEATKGELPKSAIGAVAPVEVLRFLPNYVTVFMKRSTKARGRPVNTWDPRGGGRPVLPGKYS
jgi:hypothetical protein